MPYNYGQAGAELGTAAAGQHPELVSHDGVIAFRCGAMVLDAGAGPKPSCHAVMTGQWQPDARDRRLGRRPGFGMTINIINGGEECRQVTRRSERNGKTG
jgi:pimeloyl-ACP methyl ester carboxylesterase